MSKNQIPEWATKPGTTVVLEPGGYGRRTFQEVTITRVTNASVFVKSAGGRERRFVPSRWNNDNERMMEYGQSTAWGPGTYIWNPTCERIEKGMESSRVQNLKDAVAKAARYLADEMTKDGRTGEHIESAIGEVRAAIEAYEAGK